MASQSARPALHRANHFDALRLIAALAVLVSHAFALSGQAEPQVAPGMSLGTLGVAVFFVISGYLITSSWHRNPGLARYASRRARRILPALAVSVMASAFIIGPLVTSLSLQDYFSRGQTWAFPLRNILMYPAAYALPGVFGGQPVHAVNGSLWTLQYEITMYLVVPVLAAMATRRPKRHYALLLPAVILLCTHWLDPSSLRILAPYFLAGMLLYAFRRRIHALTLVGFVALWPVAMLTPLASLYPQLAVPFIAIGLAQGDVRLLRPLSAVCRRVGDLSYGVYLWAYPLEQTAVHLLGHNPVLVLATAGPATVAVAALSWHFIEAPFLGRQAATGPRTPTSSPTASPELLSGAVRLNPGRPVAP